MLLAEDFNIEDLREGFSVQCEEQCIDKDQLKNGPPQGDGWREGVVRLHVPKEKEKHSSENDAPVLDIDGLYYRPLVEVIRAAYEDPSAKQFEYTPYQLHFCDEDGGDGDNRSDHQPSEQIYTEVYTADAILEKHERICSLPRNSEDKDDVPYAVAALMIWSDSTHLANFGTASLWPIYLFFSNLTKYICCKPTSFAVHYLAYVPSVSSHFTLPACSNLTNSLHYSSQTLFKTFTRTSTEAWLP